MGDFTHLDSNGHAVMVDLSEKPVSQREATAQGEITVSAKVMQAIESGGTAKGDVLNIARIAGIMGAKKTSDLIPLCHPLPLTNLSISFHVQTSERKIKAVCTAKTQHITGVEMEAITGVSIALLTIYDMCKAIDKDMVISNIHLVQKSGGKSGLYVRDTPTSPTC